MVWIDFGVNQVPMVKLKHHQMLLMQVVPLLMLDQRLLSFQLLNRKQRNVCLSREQLCYTLILLPLMNRSGKFDILVGRI